MSLLAATAAVPVPGFIQRIADLLEVDVHVAVRSFARVLVIWLLAWIGMRVITLLAQRIERSVDDHDPQIVSLREKRGKTISQLLRSVGRVVVVTIALMLTLNVFIDIGPILAGAGILGLAVSFGAQSLVKDVLSGFFMLLENQFALGDVIEVVGKSGVVERITLRVVMLRDLEGALHIVPNGEIKTVSNKTRGWSRAVVDVQVPYTEDVDRAIGIVKDEAERLTHDDECAALLAGQPEVWGVESLSDTALTIRMVAKTQPGSNGGVAREFRRRIRKRLEREGIYVPRPPAAPAAETAAGPAQPPAAGPAGDLTRERKV
jgi:small conductance mechanosensitive channel